MGILKLRLDRIRTFYYSYMDIALEIVGYSGNLYFMFLYSRHWVVTRFLCVVPLLDYRFNVYCQLHMLYYIICVFNIIEASSMK